MHVSQSQLDAFKGRLCWK